MPHDENRGGPRSLGPGQASGQRTDLNATQRTLPAQAAPGQTYGQAGAQQAAQEAVPMATQPSAAGQAGPRPPGLTDPSGRPGEPLTAGAPVGPGPGPEALTTPNLDVQQLRRYLPALEAAANQQSSSAAFRNWVRRLRGAIPPQVEP